jgi:hypothetical protein
MSQLIKKTSSFSSDSRSPSPLRVIKDQLNYGIIVEVGGGWHTIDELKKSYGQIPPEKILEIIG